jgi:hypothetical protein
MRADSVEICSGFDNQLKIYLTALYSGGSDLHWKGFGSVYMFNHTFNIGYVNYRLQFIYYKQLTIYGHPPKIIK